MNFLLGLALVMLVLPFNYAVIKLVPRIAPELSQGIVFIMMFGTLGISCAYLFGIAPETTNRVQFLAGAGLAFTLNMGFKISYMLLNPIKNG